MNTEQAVRTINALARRHRVQHRQILDFRRPHFRMDEHVGPKLMEPIDHISYQHDAPRQTWTKLRARLVENHYRIQMNPLDETRSRKDSDAVQALLNAWATLVEQRLGYTLQEMLADGQIVDCYGVLHWRRMDTIWPDIPEHEYLDEAPSGAESRNYVEQDDGRYKEKDEALQKRAAHSRAQAGCPYYIDVLDPTQVFFTLDITGNVGTAAWIREVGYVDYRDAIAEDGNLELFIDSTKKLQVREKGAPANDELSGPDYDKVTVATLWTKREWIELVSEAGVSTRDKADASEFHAWTEVKRGTHSFGRPPFEIALADMFNEQDPAYRYMPALEGIYRLKPMADRETSIVLGLSERHAVPDMWWETQPGQLTPELDAAGREAALGTDAASAGRMPPGYRLQMANVQINAAMIQMAELTRTLMEEAAPDTGVAELTATTQPWTARLAMQQANVYPKHLLLRQVLALQNMWRSILADMATGELGPLWAYRLDDEGRETSELIGVEPSQIKTLNLTVDIDAVSSTEQITLVEHGANMLERRLITPEDFYAHYKGEENPSQYMMELEGREVWERFIKPGLIAQAVAEKYGPQVVPGPDGGLIGMGGQPVDPNQFVQDNGWEQAQPQGGIAQGQQGMRMPGLEDQPPPGVMPQPSLPG